MPRDIINGTDGFGHRRSIDYSFAKSGDGQLTISLPAKLAQLLAENIQLDFSADSTVQRDADELVKLRGALYMVLDQGQDFTPFEWPVAPPGGMLRPDEDGS